MFNLQSRIDTALQNMLDDWDSFNEEYKAECRAEVKKLLEDATDAAGDLDTLAEMVREL